MIKNTSTNYLGMEKPSNCPSIHIKQLVLNEYTVNFSQEFDHPSYYDEVVTLLLSADEVDSFVFVINNFGGRVDALNSILNALAVTKATVTGFLVGQGCSCASVLFLACHSWIVGDNTTLMIHEQSFFVGGKASETKKQHEHYQIQNDRFIREAYRDFLNSDEIESCLRGEDYYFEDFEIRERLQHREEMKGKKLQQDIQDQLDTPADLSEHSTESLEEGLKLLELDKKDIQAELRKRKKATHNSN